MQTGEKALLLFAEYAKWEETDYCVNNLGVVYEDERVEEEAKQCVDKVKERRMGYLFENMEKMDIQEERRKTAEAQQKLEEAQKENAEASVRTIISLCMEFGRTKEEAVQKLMEKASLNKEQAETAVKHYWKEK